MKNSVKKTITFSVVILSLTFVSCEAIKKCCAKESCKTEKNTCSKCGKASCDKSCSAGH